MNTFLYIDPGTGSMLFSLFIGIATAAVFGIKKLFIKLKFSLSSGKRDTAADKEVLPYVIFSDHKRYWNVFSSICDEFEKLKIPLTYYTCSSDDPVLSQNYEYVKGEFIGEGNKPFVKLNFLKADKVISTTPGLDVYQWKRSKNVNKYIHIPHSIDDLSNYKMFGLDHYDVVLASGQNQIDFINKIEALRNINKKEMHIVGSTYMDGLLAKKNGLSDTKKTNKLTVLVAPSWGKNSILCKFGEKFLTALTKTDFEIIVRPHPQSKTADKEVLDSLMKKFPDIDWNFDNDNFSIMNQSDVLISDFSSIIFDYSFIFERPVIYADTDFDTSTFDADWVDETLWAQRVLPKIGLQLKEKDFDNISDIIKDLIQNKTLSEDRNNIINECWCYKGEASKRIMDYLLNKQ